MSKRTTSSRMDGETMRETLINCDGCKAVLKEPTIRLAAVREGLFGTKTMITKELCKKCFKRVEEALK